MRYSMLTAAACAAVLGSVAAIAPAQAQASRTWVSGVGDDVNPCSRTAPCKTFAGAISKTQVNGEINCLDPGGFGAVTITKSITIDCIWIPGSILNAGFNAVNIPFDNFGADVRKQVRLRGLNMQGADSGTNGVRITGGATITGGIVTIEDVLIDGNFAGTARGVTDERQGAGELHILNTTIRNNGGTGIVVQAALNTSGVFATISNVRVINNGSGAFFNSSATAVITNSVLSGNTNAGVDVENSANVTVVKSVLSKNGANGLFTSGGGTVQVGDSTIAYNGTQASGGWLSYGNNRVVGNPGTAPTAAGPISNELGQK
jgi:hypothetical protein